MTLTEIKSTFFGYSKTDVCRYISELNEVHSAELSAVKEQLNQQAEEYDAKCSTLESEKCGLEESVSSLKSEVESLKAQLLKYENENKELKANCARLEEDAADLSSKREIISTAIINAERCAGNLIDDATSRANHIVNEAEDKVNCEMQRLEKAKRYVSEIRTSLAVTMRNIDNALISAENSIDDKKNNIKNTSSASADEKKFAVREKLGSLEKNVFKRA